MSSHPLTRKSEFISVEISIRTNTDSVAFVEWFQDQDNYVNKVPCESHKWYIYCDPIHGANADTVISKLCHMIREFPEDVRRDWDNAHEREFYAGYRVGEEPFCHTEHIRLDTLKSAISVNAGIGFSLYPAELTDEEGLPEDFQNT